MQVLQRRLDQRAPVIDTEEDAAKLGQLMCIIQQHHHPLLCRSYVVPCFLTSSTQGTVRRDRSCACVVKLSCASQRHYLNC